MPKDGLHLDEVYDTLEGLFSTDRNCHGAGSSTKDVLHLANNLEKVGTGAVHLVDITDTGNVILVGLTPNGFRLGLYTTDSAVGCYSTVKHAERTLHLSGKVNVSRSVNQVELILVTIIVPECSGSGRSDGDTALLLLLHPVHGSCTFVNLTDLVGLTGVEKDTLGRGGLTGIDVGHDTDVTSQVEVLLSHNVERKLRYLCVIRNGNGRKHG